MTPPIGRARVPTRDQAPCPGRGQKIRRLLRRSHEERASGGRARPELAPAPERIGRGDALVVAPIDRIARSLPHLLEAVERLEAKCTVIPSLQDLIDARRVAGSGCAAEFARALIRERTKAGLASAPAKGRVGGKPGLRARDPAELRKARLTRQDGYMECLAVSFMLCSA